MQKYVWPLIFAALCFTALARDDEPQDVNHIPKITVSDMNGNPILVGDLVAPSAGTVIPINGQKHLNNCQHVPAFQSLRLLEAHGNVAGSAQF